MGRLSCCILVVTPLYVSCQVFSEQLSVVMLAFLACIVTAAELDPTPLMHHLGKPS